MTIQRILDRKGAEVIKISPSATVKNAAERMRLHRIAALVVEGGDPIGGIITERDVVRAIAEYGEQALLMAVRQVMTQAIITITADDSVTRAMGLMTRHRIRHLPVIADGRLAGIISIGDVVKHRLEDLELESNILRDAYIAAH